MKNDRPWGAKGVPISIPDEVLRERDEFSGGGFTYEHSPAKTDIIQVHPDILRKFGAPQDVIDRGEVAITFTGRETGRKDDKGNPIYFFGVNDKLVREIVITNKFERPIYYINSAGNDAYVGLQNHLRMEGVCSRVCPIPQATNQRYAFNEEVMNAVLLNVDNSDDFSKTPKYGLKLRNLNNTKVTYDEVDRRTVGMTYIMPYIMYAAYLAEVKRDFELAEKVLDTYLEYIP
jgi:hypothetical protein